MSEARIFDGYTWSAVPTETVQTQRPIIPVLDGDGSVFVSVVNYRDGKRCGKTLLEIFDKAKDPDAVVVGLVEQNSEEDHSCLEEFCQAHDVTIFRRNEIRADTVKVIATDKRKDCPRIQQIRKLAFHHLSAKGPAYARSMNRKLLGDEEFCLQIDAHTTRFVQDWDEKLKHQWAATGNEFGIISTVPESIDGDSDAVPRQCSVEFMDTRVPGFVADGKVQNIHKPLLARAWSAGFSFSKCHLEEVAPYDPFMPYVMGVEQFLRYARLWTRGYDVYTPTENIVFHDFAPQPEGHATAEWMFNRDDALRRKALDRARSILGLPEGDDGLNLHNLGIYGLGKRRTLQQLAAFVGIRDIVQQSTLPPSNCYSPWVPYDANISPLDHLFSNPDDLEPQPEFPLRLNPAFYEKLDELSSSEDSVVTQSHSVADRQSPFPAFSTLFTLWVLGLVVWCVAFVYLPNRRFQSDRGRARRRGRVPDKRQD